MAGAVRGRSTLEDERRKVVMAPKAPDFPANWSQPGSNRRPLACHASALPTELWPRAADSSELGRRGFELDRRYVAPQILESVVAARLRGEDVEHDVEVIGDDPGSLRGALERGREDPVVTLQPPVHLVLDRLRLPWVLAAADDEKVRVDTDRTHVEDDDVLRQLALGEASDAAGLFAGDYGRKLSLLLRPTIGRQAPAPPPPRHSARAP